MQIEASILCFLFRVFEINFGVLCLIWAAELANARRMIKCPILYERSRIVQPCCVLLLLEIRNPSRIFKSVVRPFWEAID
jgi:hypothetical protein